MDFLLQQPDIDINKRNLDGETALLHCIEHESAIAAIKLIEAGADVNISDIENKSPLHCAIEKHLLDLASLVIKKGADINAVCKLGSFTPLHLAVYVSSYEMTALLLYYGADTDVVTKRGRSPFMLSLRKSGKLELKDVEIQELLLDFEIDFNRTDKKGLTTLQIALENCSPFIPDLIERGADVNFTPRDNYTDVLQYAFLYKDSSLFETIWSKYNYHVVYADKRYRPSLIESFDEAQLPVKDWLECLTLVFHSNLIHDVIQDHRRVTELSTAEDDYFGMFELFCGLLTRMFNDRKLSEDVLYPFICITLSEGADVYYSDVVTVYEYYGYNETLKLFLYFNIAMNEALYVTYPILPVFICEITKDPKTEMNKLEIPIQYAYERIKHINDLLDMFTPPQEFVNQIEEFLEEFPRTRKQSYSRIDKRLRTLSVASLRELSRDTFKKVVCDKLNVKSCLEFYTAVNKLPIPSVVKEMLAYQVPVNK